MRSYLICYCIWVHPSDSSELSPFLSLITLSTVLCKDEFAYLSPPSHREFLEGRRHIVFSSLVPGMMHTLTRCLNGCVLLQLVPNPLSVEWRKHKGNTSQFEPLTGSPPRFPRSEKISPAAKLCNNTLPYFYSPYFTYPFCRFLCRRLNFLIRKWARENWDHLVLHLCTAHCTRHGKACVVGTGGNNLLNFSFTSAQRVASAWEASHLVGCFFMWCCAHGWEKGNFWLSFIFLWKISKCSTLSLRVKWPPQIVLEVRGHFGQTEAEKHGFWL